MRRDTNEDPEEQNEEAEQRCPYCSAEGSCPHVLLTVDVTFRVADDGPLRDWFNDHWSELLELHDDDPKWDERAAFDELLELVDGAADSAPPAKDHEGGPGQSSTIQRFYCESAERFNAAVSRLRLPFSGRGTDPPKAASREARYFSEADQRKLQER